MTGGIERGSCLRLEFLQGGQYQKPREQKYLSPLFLSLMCEKVALTSACARKNSGKYLDTF